MSLVEVMKDSINKVISESLPKDIEPHYEVNEKGHQKIEEQPPESTKDTLNVPENHIPSENNPNQIPVILKPSETQKPNSGAYTNIPVNTKESKESIIAIPFSKKTIQTSTGIKFNIYEKKDNYESLNKLSEISTNVNVEENTGSKKENKTKDSRYKKFVDNIKNLLKEKTFGETNLSNVDITIVSEKDENQNDGVENKGENKVVNSNNILDGLKAKNTDEAFQAKKKIKFNYSSDLFKILMILLILIFTFSTLLCLCYFLGLLNH